ncbi:GPP34 family phosphoprotein [Streptomyces sp. NBC_00887]|uniref:GPP34 family phosphoprotein n=1 Tax=Streptomyces sp. NBC_00887 TaxID=2975859 RepID=UPI00386DFB57|nr:GPP34 family phosphoprotein [Streptomyces sp. NBC_00887]WSY36213.1 GPP34 family phosphoprotein [Streptomyces sp. NBC_00887]
MTTAKDLFMIAIDLGPNPSVRQGDLSLALAGAELIDLIEAEAVTLDDNLIASNSQHPLDDHFLREASSALTGQAEHVEDWLWRRGRDLSAAYQGALEEIGQLKQARHSRFSLRAARLELVDTPDRRGATSRWNSDEPVLVALAAAAGIDRSRSVDGSILENEAVTTVLDAVHNAVMELEAERQKRTIENEAFDNVWRLP